MASIIDPTEVTKGDIVAHLVDRKGRPLGGIHGYTSRGPVIATRDVPVTQYGGPGTYLTFTDQHEAGPFLNEHDLLLLANR